MQHRRYVFSCAGPLIAALLLTGCSTSEEPDDFDRAPDRVATDLDAVDASDLQLPLIVEPLRLADSEVTDQPSAGIPVFDLQTVTDRPDDVDDGRVIYAGRLVRSSWVGIEPVIALSEVSLTDCVERGARDTPGAYKMRRWSGLDRLVESDGLGANRWR